MYDLHSGDERGTTSIPTLKYLISARFPPESYSLDVTGLGRCWGYDGTYVALMDLHEVAGNIVGVMEDHFGDIGSTASP